MKLKDFTTGELMFGIAAIIAVVIIAIVVAVGPRKADAQTLGPRSQMVTFLSANQIPFIWNAGVGHLTIFTSIDNNRFATAAAACAELRAKEERLARITLNDASGTTEATELYWSAEQVISNLSERDVADCL